MEKRKIIFGNYDTAANGWTLTGWAFGAAEQKTNYVEKAGGDGSWDLSTALTDGIPKYKDRPLVATFERSDGDRMSRETAIRHMVNLLDGMREDIVLPDDSTHYINGRLHVAKDYNDPAHAAITVTGVCKPWKFANTEKTLSLTASSTKRTTTLTNDGRQTVVPVLTVTGSSASVLLAYGNASKSFSAGTYQWPELQLTPGSHTLTYSGSGTLKITYREAVLE